MYIHDPFEKAMEEGHRLVSVLELGNLQRSEWKLEHEFNQCLYLSNDHVPTDIFANSSSRLELSHPGDYSPSLSLSLSVFSVQP